MHGQTFDVDNNIWVVGDDDECIVIDAPHRVDDVLDVVGDRRVTAIVCTHAHDDHVRIAPETGRRTGAPVLLHPADLPVWRLTHPDVDPDGELADGQVISVAGTDLRVLHTPGHSPGAVCLYAPELGVVFTGGHAVLRRAGSHRSQLLRPRHDPRLDPGQAAHPAAGHRGAHRTRRIHHHRSGGGELRLTRCRVRQRR